MKNTLRRLSALLVATLVCSTLQADERGARKDLFWGAASGAPVRKSQPISRQVYEPKNARAIDSYEHKICTYQTIIADHQRSIKKLNLKRAALTKQKSATARSIDREMKHIDSKIKSHEKKINRLQFKIKDLERKIDRLS